MSDYFAGVEEWLGGFEASVSETIAAPHPSGQDPYSSSICTETAERKNAMLAENAFENYARWSRTFEESYNAFVTVLNRWRRDRRLERLIEQQLESFDRANPLPFGASPGQVAAIESYSGDVKRALGSLLRSQKLAKPPPPVPSAAELSPERGLAIFTAFMRPDALVLP